jgi:hypothetical protein
MTMRRTILAAVLALCTLRPALAETVGIERLAPKDSWLVIGIDDLAATRERWDRTAIRAWWGSETVQKLVRDDLDRSGEDARKRLRELGVAEDAWSAPRAVGFAMFPSFDEALDSDQPHFLLYGEWTDGADGVASIFEAVMAEHEKNGPGRVRAAEIRGRKATAITVKPEEPKPEIGKDGRPRRPRPRRGGLFEEGGMFQHVETIWYVRDGSRFLLGTLEKEIDEALGALEGQARPCVADESDFKAALDQVGRADGWMTLMTAPMQRVAGVGGPQMGFLQPMFTSLFGEVRAYGFSVAVGGDESQVELCSGILVKGERMGVFALPDPARPAQAPPKFAPSDAVGYGSIQLQLRDVMKLLETAASNLPEEMSEMVDPTLQQYGPDLRKAFDALGPEVHVISRTAPPRPGDDPEDQGVYAIACRDEQAVTGLLNLFLPEAGFEPRDFNGNTVFSAPDGETSMGFGGGMFYMGSAKAVEQCLRGGEGGLADSAACRQALAAVGAEPVLGWGYTDLVGAIEAQRTALVASARRAEGRMVPKDQREIADRVGIDLPDGVVDDLGEIDARSLSEGFGPMQWDMRSVREGLVTRLRLLRPAKAD